MSVNICTMGELLVEFLSKNNNQGFMQAGEFLGPYPSGAPAIYAAQVARLGFGSTLFGCVGNDDFGRLNIERLRFEGVITDGISVIDKAPTGTAFVSYRTPQERDFIFNIPNSACGFFTADHIDSTLLSQCQHFHIMGSSLFSFRIIDAMRRAIQIIKANGGTVSFDPNIRKEMLNIPEMSQAFDYILEYTDIFLPSEGELHHFASSKNQKEAGIVRDLLDGGVKHIVIKRGQQGASHYQHIGGRVVEQHTPGYTTTMMDPTGAGDCFGATFVSLFLSGYPVEKTLQYANASGALAVSHKGPMEGLSSLTQIEQFILEQSHAGSFS
ncbi:sugar kinase [Yersinia pseudotuberculosis]|uniref:Aminoimidazole riboside kinase n=2 Tax=Yersinia pseudotuberculosis complex TaxID=1649845 RepID=A0A0T9J3F5_YERPU|nr:MULTISPECIES: sugar kinase [Yersinia pseudotuberculosis complex]PSH12346.1 sugar kinase [Yersinia pseudotuberculosis]CNB77074.1 aminoimidazole riboside kinase [Yersinia pseudotuberculosis]CRG50243.1 aminoimidazole riboside kinase [Yersinia wautersii]SUP84617.1 aminoimidazole riboside kinase [Yersinia pseudotuberculosis]